MPKSPRKRSPRLLVIIGLGLITATMARLTTTLFSATPQLNQILRGQHTALASQLMGVEGNLMQPVGMMCNNIVGEVQNQLVSSVPVISQFANVSGQLTGQQALANIVPDLANATGVQHSVMHSLLDRTTQLHSTLSPAEFSSTMQSMMGAKAASQSNVLGAVTSSQSLMGSGSQRLAGDNQLVRNFIQSSGSSAVVEMVVKNVPRTGILSELDQLQAREGAIGQVIQRY